jgi:hypothetical protein
VVSAPTAVPKVHAYSASSALPLASLAAVDTVARTLPSAGSGWLGVAVAILLASS